MFLDDIVGEGSDKFTKQSARKPHSHKHEDSNMPVAADSDSPIHEDGGDAWYSAPGQWSQGGDSTTFGDGAGNAWTGGGAGGMGVTEESGASAQDIFNAIAHRLEYQKPDVFRRYGVEYVADAIKDVADFHAGATELGSSDVSGMVREVMRRLTSDNDVQNIGENDRLYQHHQERRRAAGLPDPKYYKEKIALRDRLEGRPAAEIEAALAALNKKYGLSEDILARHAEFDLIESWVQELADQHGVDAEVIWEDFEAVDDATLLETAAWKRKAGKSKTGGLNKKGVASYRREHPGSKLQTAVTTKPSKLKKGSKAAKRRKSFCARMSGVKGPMKDKNGKPTRKALALRKWNCHESVLEAANAAQQAAIAIAKKKKAGMSEGNAAPLTMNQLATISDAALDAAYHYGRSQPGNTFGWQANLKSAAYAKQMIDQGVTDIESISDAIHKGWNITAQAFVKNPMQFDDSKTMPPEKLQAKVAQRQKLMTQNYSQLPEEEKEKDRVVARALLQALTGQQGMAEGKQPGKPVVDVILKVMPVAQEIWFHGSRATGQHRKNSDTDILVVIPDDLVGDQYLSVVRILQKLSSHFDNYDIQPTKAGTNIHRIAQEEGRLLWSSKQGVAEDFPQPGESSGKAKQFNPNAKVQTKEMTLDQILSTVKGIPYVNNVIDDWDTKDYSWGVTKKVIEYAQYLQKNPQSVANLPPLVVIDGQLNDGAHRLSAINLLQKRMDPTNPLWKRVKLKVNFGTSADVAPEQGVAETTMAQSADHPMGPEFVGKWAGTDSAAEAKHKLVGEEAITEWADFTPGEQVFCKAKGLGRCVIVKKVQNMWGAKSKFQDAHGPEYTVKSLSTGSEADVPAHVLQKLPGLAVNRRNLRAQTRQPDLAERNLKRLENIYLTEMQAAGYDLRGYDQ